MLLASILAFYLFGMSGDAAARLDVIAQVEKELTEIVQDETRKAKAIDVVAEMKAIVNQQHVDYSELQADYLKINADYNADKQRYDDLDKKVDKFWRATMQQQVDLRLALREQLTREEWKELYKEIY